MEFVLHYDKVVPSPRGGAGALGWVREGGSVPVLGAEPRPSPGPGGRRELGEVLPDTA